MMACTDEQLSNEREFAELNSTYKLSSPRGIQIAKDEKQLLEKLSIPDVKSSDKFEVESIEYFEDNTYSYASVNVYVNAQFYSVFLINEMPKGKIILQDKHSLKIVDTAPAANQTGETLTFTSTKSGSESARCFGGDCCKWQTVVAGSEYNCGCPSTLEQDGTGIIFTTSDGCKIEL